MVLTGQPDHAGATPMDRRADALVAAAALVTDIAKKARVITKDPFGGLSR